MNKQTECRIGVIGAANIAKKIWTAAARAGGAHIAAVAARHPSRAETFVDECQRDVPMISGDRIVDVKTTDYESMIASDDIDAVYLPIPTSLRIDWAVAAAKSGKHVLIEKPAAVHSDDLRRLDEAARSAGVTWMDGVMFDHSPRTAAIADAIAQGAVGQVRRIATHFSFAGDEAFFKNDIRVRSDLEPHGALGDLGWYGIRFTLRCRPERTVESVRGQTLWDVDGVPAEFEGQMRFDDGAIGSVFCSFRSANQQTAVVSGSDAYLTVDDFVLQFNGSSADFDVHRHDLDIDRCRWIFNRRTQTTSVAAYSHGERGASEVNMIERLAARFRGEDDSGGSFDPARVSMATQRIVDAMRSSDVRGGVWTPPEFESAD